MKLSCSFSYFNFPVFFFILLNRVTNQNQYLTVRRTTFIVGFRHFFTLSKYGRAYESQDYPTAIAIFQT